MKKKMIILLCLALFLCLLCGCGAKEQPAAMNKTCAELADLAAASTAFQELADANAKYLAKHLMVDAEMLEDWCLRMDNTRATSEMICILKVKHETDQKTVKESLEDYRTEQAAIYRDYAPAEAVKLEKARVLENGAYLALIVSPDADKTASALGGGWR